MLKVKNVLFMGLLLCAMFFLVPNSAQAAETTLTEEDLIIDESFILVYQGCTENGIPYEVYKPASEEVISSRAVVTKNVTRYVRFSPATVTPPQEIYWTENLDSYTVMEGWLTWNGTYVANFMADYIDACYKGDLVGRI